MKTFRVCSVKHRAHTAVMCGLWLLVLLTQCLSWCYLQIEFSPPIICAHGRIHADTTCCGAHCRVVNTKSRIHGARWNMDTPLLTNYTVLYSSSKSLCRQRSSGNCPCNNSSAFLPPCRSILQAPVTRQPLRLVSAYSWYNRLYRPLHPRSLLSFPRTFSGLVRCTAHKKEPFESAFPHPSSSCYPHNRRQDDLDAFYSSESIPVNYREREQYHNDPDTLFARYRMEIGPSNANKLAHRLNIFIHRRSAHKAAAKRMEESTGDGGEVCSASDEEESTDRDDDNVFGLDWDDDEEERRELYGHSEERGTSGKGRRMNRKAREGKNLEEAEEDDEEDVVQIEEDGKDPYPPPPPKTKYPMPTNKEQSFIRPYIGVFISVIARPKESEYPNREHQREVSDAGMDAGKQSPQGLELDTGVEEQTLLGQGVRDFQDLCDDMEITEEDRFRDPLTHLLNRIEDEEKRVARKYEVVHQMVDRITSQFDSQVRYRGPLAAKEAEARELEERFKMTKRIISIWGARDLLILPIASPLQMELSRILTKELPRRPLYVDVVRDVRSNIKLPIVPSALTSTESESRALNLYPNHASAMNRGIRRTENVVPEIMGDTASVLATMANRANGGEVDGASDNGMRVRVISQSTRQGVEDNVQLTQGSLNNCGVVDKDKSDETPRPHLAPCPSVGCEVTPVGGAVINYHSITAPRAAVRILDSNITEKCIISSRRKNGTTLDSSAISNTVRGTVADRIGSCVFTGNSCASQSADSSDTSSLSSSNTRQHTALAVMCGTSQRASGDDTTDVEYIPAGRETRVTHSEPVNHVENNNNSPVIQTTKHISQDAVVTSTATCNSLKLCHSTNTNAPLFNNTSNHLSESYPSNFSKPRVPDKPFASSSLPDVEPALMDSTSVPGDSATSTISVPAVYPSHDPDVSTLRWLDFVVDDNGLNDACSPGVAYGTSSAGDVAPRADALNTNSAVADSVPDRANTVSQKLVLRNNTDTNIVPLAHTPSSGPDTGVTQTSTSMSSDMCASASASPAAVGVRVTDPVPDLDSTAVSPPAASGSVSVSRHGVPVVSDPSSTTSEDPQPFASAVTVSSAVEAPPVPIGDDSYITEIDLTLGPKPQDEPFKTPSKAPSEYSPAALRRVLYDVTDKGKTRIKLPEEMTMQERLADEQRHVIPRHMQAGLGLAPVKTKPESVKFWYDNSNTRLVTPPNQCPACGAPWQTSNPLVPGHIPVEIAQFLWHSSDDGTHSAGKELMNAAAVDCLSVSGPTVTSQEHSSSDVPTHLEPDSRVIDPVTDVNEQLQEATRGKRIDAHDEDRHSESVVGVDEAAQKEKFKTLLTKHRERDEIICSRCHKLRAGNHIDECLRPGWSRHEFLTPNRFRELIAVIRNKRCILLYILDIMEFELFPQISKFFAPKDKAHVFVVANKVDLLPNKPKQVSAKHNKLVHWIHQHFLQLGCKNQVKPQHIYLVSTKTGEGMTRLLSELGESARKMKRDIYVIGAANAGKSTLINYLLEAPDPYQTKPKKPKRNNEPLIIDGEEIDESMWHDVEMKKRIEDEQERKRQAEEKKKEEERMRKEAKHALKKPRVTTSRLPGTTLDVVRVDVSQPFEFFDTPGLILPNALTTYLNQNELRSVLPRSRLRPPTIRMVSGKTLLVGALARLDCLDVHTTPSSYGFNFKHNVSWMNSNQRGTCYQGTTDILYPAESGYPVVSVSAKQSHDAPSTPSTAKPHNRAAEPVDAQTKRSVAGGNELVADVALEEQEADIDAEASDDDAVGHDENDSEYEEFALDDFEIVTPGNKKLDKKRRLQELRRQQKRKKFLKLFESPDSGDSNKVLSAVTDEEGDNVGIESVDEEATAGGPMGNKPCFVTAFFSNDIHLHYTRTLKPWNL
eukprot:GHVQ01000896.1.p1 GENE.GHVQ01000896.1~~GHVQ01000896.1.p1  ORF type:complete len:1882 (-),score=274.31 GHVQ01000896.1:578-6223(-)